MTITAAASSARNLSSRTPRTRSCDRSPPLGTRGPWGIGTAVPPHPAFCSSPRSRQGTDHSRPSPRQTCRGSLSSSGDRPDLLGRWSRTGVLATTVNVRASGSQATPVLWAVGVCSSWSGSLDGFSGSVICSAPIVSTRGLLEEQVVISWC